MSPTWDPDSVTASADQPISALGWARVVLRGGALTLLIAVCLLAMMILRLIERPLYGLKRPLTPYITQFVCRTAFVILGMQYRVEGALMKQAGAVVANHASWLDIFTLNARKRIYFVSKSEVANWPGIGVLAKATGTVFINRKRHEAKAQTEVFKDRLGAGHKLLFFPEGTSTDGVRVLNFKSTLFAAFLSDTLKETMWIQPVTVVYRSPEGEDARFYGWWGDMGFGPHMLKVLAAPRQGSATVVYHSPLRVADYDNRKILARDCEAAVRAGLPTDIQALA